MALVDPNIALSFKQPNFQPTNALAQYSQIANIQNAMQSQQMNQARLEEYQRARQEEEGVRNFLTQNPRLTADQRTQLLGMGATGREVGKQLTAADQAATAQQTSQQTLSANAQKAYQNIVSVVGTKQEAIKFLTTMINDPAVAGHPITKVPLMDLVARIPEDPAGLDQWKRRFAMGATAWAEKTMPQFFAQDRGNVKEILKVDPATGQATVVPGSSATVGQSPSNVIAERQANLAQQKFDYEKANPGFDLKENEDGTFYKINKMTGQASPVVIGTAANGGAATGGTPTPEQAAFLTGKGKDMTEAQSNAAMFGGAMAQAISNIDQLERSGTVKNAALPSMLQSIAKLAPFGFGDQMANIIMSTFNADPTGFAGPDAAQQRLAQAQLSFAIAYLRKTSGAAFGASEVSSTIREFFPLIGEGDSVAKQKSKARSRAMQGMRISTTKSGREYIDSYRDSGDTVIGGGAAGGAADPLGLFTKPTGAN